MVDILGWVIDAIPSFIKSRICSKEELKQKHLADIKKEVLEPVLRILDEIYIPVLESKKPIIEYTSHYVQWKGIDVRQYSGKHEHELKVVSPDSERWNQNLYSDTKENHYKDFLSSYEKFRIDFESYGNKWLSYAVEIQKTIKDEVGMPLFEGDNTKESFVEPKALASYIIGKIMRANPSPIDISETIIGVTGFPWALKGTRDDIQRCIELVNRQIADDKKYERLYPEQEILLKNAILLKSELDKIVKTYKLHGKCGYV